MFTQHFEYYENAGKPSKLLGAHSFRSAFYCQSYLNGMKNGFPIEVMNELTMVLAGWKNLKDQLVYKKDELKALITFFGIVDSPTPEQMLGYNGKFINKWNDYINNKIDSSSDSDRNKES